MRNSQADEFAEDRAALKRWGLRAELAAILPPRMMKLPIDARGYPVPWFVGYVDGVPDFRVIRPDGIGIAHRKGLCWLCGEPLGVRKAFVIGPMCAVTRVSSEPPSHRACAVFAAKACPFLTHPMAKRRDNSDLPEGLAKQPAGVHLERNPGAVAIWITRNYHPFRAPGGVLFQLGTPVEVSWWAEGRAATYQEVNTSILSGLPFLTEQAEKDGQDGLDDLARHVRAVQPLLPAHDEPCELTELP